MRKPGAVCALFAAILLAATVFTPLLVETTTLAASRQEEGEKKKKRGLRKGAATGAIAGLALGAVAGEAAAGAAVGAAVGAASGAWYDYDQDRQDDRTQMLADGLAGRSSTPPPPGTAPPDPAPGETVGAMGHRHMKDFIGDWNVEIWALDENRERVTASGKARGMQAGENATRILFQEVKVAGYDETLGGGTVLLTYEPNQGFFLTSDFQSTGEKLNFVGEYLADKNVYSYYLTTNEGQFQGGMLRSSVRVEVRVGSPSIFFADTYTHIDGEEVHVQSYRFIKS